MTLNSKDKIVVAQGPILSICIPTFNRAKSLVHLLSQIQSFDFDLKGSLEICVSNNCSTDNTDDVIRSFKETTPGVKYIVQSQNIGGSFNVGEVVKLATAKYILLCGDDDLLNVGDLVNLIKRLRSEPGDNWYILNGGVFRWNPIANLFSRIATSLGLFTSKIYIILVGLSSIGFLGNHVMPQSVANLIKEQKVLNGWPSIAYLLSYLSKSKATCLKLSRLQVVKQSASGVLIFWYPDEIFRVALGRVRTIKFILRPNHKVLWCLLVLREIFAPVLIFYVLNIRFMYGRDGYKKYQMAVSEVFDNGCKFETAVFRVQSAIAWLIMVLPEPCLDLMVPFSIRRKINDLNERARNIDKSLNGLRRGL